MTLGLLASGARAERVSLRSYGDTEGLTSLAVTCLRQGSAGYVFACTSHGVFAFDGRRFFNLRADQGLPDGGYVLDVVFTADRRVVVRYGSGLFVSRTAVSELDPPRSLHFDPVSSAGKLLASEPKQITVWRGQVVLLADGHLSTMDVGAAGGPALALLSMTPAAAAALDHPSMVLSAGDKLWLSFQDGHLCSYSGPAYRCYGPQQGLTGGPYYSVLAQPNGTVVARSGDALATIDPATDHVVVQSLPFQDARFANYPEALEVIRLPSGDLLTQCADGFIVGHDSTWRRISVADGLPAAPAVAPMVDQQGSLWFSALGHGIYRAFGYGQWENRDSRDGLTDNVVWQVVRQPGGPLWVATDLGVDAIDPGTAPLAKAHYPGSSFSIAMGARGQLWRSGGQNGLSRIDLRNGTVQNFALPSITQIARCIEDRLWVASEHGLFFVDDTAGTPGRLQPVAGIAQSVFALVPDRDGSVWYISQNALMHWHTDGSIVPVVTEWKQRDFEPMTLALGASGEVWVGGTGGGLYCVDLAGDQLRGLQNYQPPQLISSSVLSVMVDRRGWVWAGTDRGVSVFDRSRWISVNSDSGLVWNDTSQVGLYDDVDGSVWISTSQGLSHLPHPEALFRLSPVQVVISSLSLGDRLFPQRAVNYTTDPLDVQFGTMDFRAERSIVFRYRLDGVDSDWATTSTSAARYPFVPAGDHRFTVIAIDTLTGRSSLPASFVIRIKKPWWTSWPMRTGYALAAALAAVSLWQARYRHLLHRQHVLEKTVETRTEQIRVAQEALLLQATRDGLTGLLNRAEVQKRFATMLAASNDAERLVVSLVDIDHFKRINDTHGHLAGDEILQGISERIRDILRPGECAGRYGGEEVLILMSDWDGMAAARILELNEAIRCEPFMADGREVSITSSIGIGWAESGDDWKSLIGRIDQALYRAKHAGRDRVIEADTRMRLTPGRG